ncbi:MAG TPA: diacylglycerol kinase family protein [Frankiaceae bacterium]|nr:diacylglycerol kinase family protein [Frankiaceae bacterium]
MRALLVVNPNATATSARTRDVLASALGSDLRIDVERTKSRGHAIELGAQAVQDGYELVVALGGDGTVNEVVNGLLADGPKPGLPAFAAVPGGSTNVFARALGYSADPVEATSELLDHLREGRTRRISLGHSESTEGDRWFTFNAGFGLDAEVVRRVDAKRKPGRRATKALYVRTAVLRYYLGTHRRRPAMTVTGPDIPDPTPLYLALVCNADPWTYFGDWPVRPCPEARFEDGLDLFGMTRLRTFQTLRHVAQLFARDADPHGKRVVRLHDTSELTLTAEEPLPFQVDGEPLADRAQVTLRSVPGALRVVA